MMSHFIPCLFSQIANGIIKSNEATFPMPLFLSLPHWCSKQQHNTPISFNRIRYNPYFHINSKGQKLCMTLYNYIQYYQLQLQFLSLINYFQGTAPIAPGISHPLSNNNNKKKQLNFCFKKTHTQKQSKKTTTEFFITYIVISCLGAL